MPPSKNIGTLKPDFSDLMRAIVDQVLMDVNVCVPAKIVAYDKDTQYADVQVQLLTGYLNGSKKPIPVIPNVPVKHPRANGGAAFIHMPLKPGDDVTLHFSHRSLDNWKTQGGMSDPADTRKHHVTDCYASIGGSAIPDAFSPSTGDCIEMVNGQSSVLLHPGGEIDAANPEISVVIHDDGKLSATNEQGELVDILNQVTSQAQQMAETLSEDTVNTIFGPQPLNSFTTYQTISESLSNLLTLLGELQGMITWH